MQYDFLSLAWFVCLVCMLALFAEAIYVWAILGRFSTHKADNSDITSTEPVSIIIAARNELKNLSENLPAILEQDYPQFEVVVVNDCSWDETQKYLEELQHTYAHLKISQLIEQEKYPTGKKFALTIGIKAASYTHLLFTDADCKPTSNQWLKLMRQSFTPGKEIVLGYAPCKKETGILNAYIRYQDMFTAMQYFGFALAKKTMMGVGRNLAYTKAVFFRHKGFASHNHILSGDDDLFVNEAATATNVSIQYHPDSFVETTAKSTYTAFIRQQLRHMHVGKYYKFVHKRILGIYYVSKSLFYVSCIGVLCIQPQLWPFVTGLFVIRILHHWILLYMGAKKLKGIPLVWMFPIFDIMHVWILFSVGIQAYFTKKLDRW